MEQEELNNVPEKTSAAQQPSGKKRVLWTIVFLVIAGLSIWAVTAQSKSFSLRRFWNFLSTADIHWIIAAVCAMFGFILFEGLALRSAANALNYRTGVLRSFSYSAADIYFSAITPSASGGQPACAYLMMRNGIPGSVTAAILLLTLAMYASSILLVGILAFALRPLLFLQYSTVSKVLILIGIVAQISLAVFFFILLKSKHLLEKICAFCIRLLGKLRLVRNKEEKQQKLLKKMEEYRSSAALLSGHKALLAKSLLFNVLQRLSQILVTVFVFLAMRIRVTDPVTVFSMQSFSVLGSNCIPIPGAVGVADYLMLDGFSTVMPEEVAVDMELLSRALSFYFCVLLCAVVVLISFRKKKQEETL